MAGAGIAQERVRFANLEEFLTLAAEDAAHEYTVAWVDCLARGRRLGRGVYLRGEHVPLPAGVRRRASGAGLRVPFDAPSHLLNRATLGAFNALQYRRGPAKAARTTVAYEPFFFPLDALGDWNRLYGAAGFLQYQCVVPDAPGGGAARAILERVSSVHGDRPPSA